MRALACFSVLGAACALLACSAPTLDPVESSDNALATPSGQAVTFTVEGDFEGTGNSSDDVLKSAVRDQLKFLLPQLHAHRAAAQLAPAPRIFDRFEVTTAGNIQRVRYVARVNGVWKGALPAEALDVVLPRTRYSLLGSEYDACAPGLETTARWQYFSLHFDPKAADCTLASEDVLRGRVTVAPRVDPEATTGKKPEYAKMWEDQKLRVVVFFDKDDNDATWTDAASTDAGIVAFRAHLAALDAKLGTTNRTETPYTAISGQPTQNVTVSHKSTLADGREIIVDSVLMNSGYGLGATYPTLPAGPPVDVAVKNASPFAAHYTDPEVAVVVNGSATPQNLMLLVENARYSYEFSLPSTPTPGLSRFKNTIQYGGDVPFAAQAAITKKVIDALEAQTMDYDALLTDIQGVNADLLPIVVGEHLNGP